MNPHIILLVAAIFFLTFLLSFWFRNVATVSVIDQSERVHQIVDVNPIPTLTPPVIVPSDEPESLVELPQAELAINDLYTSEITIMASNLQPPPTTPIDSPFQSLLNGPISTTPYPNDMLVLPIGFRCNAAKVCRDLLKITTEAHVFDWCQMSIGDTCRVLDLADDEVEAFWQEMFSNLINDMQHKVSGSWFPHDRDDEHSAIVAKYTRRTLRLNAKIRNVSSKILVTVGNCGDPLNFQKFCVLKATIEKWSPKELNTHLCFGITAETYQADNVYFVRDAVDDFSQLADPSDPDSAWNLYNAAMADKMDRILRSIAILDDDRRARVKVLLKKGNHDDEEFLGSTP